MTFGSIRLLYGSYISTVPQKIGASVFMRFVSFVYILLVCAEPVFGALQMVPRFHHTMEIFDGQMCVFGGKSTSTGVNLQDYLLDYRCIDITRKVKQSSPKWKKQSSASRFAMPPLAQHSSVYDRTNHIIIPYGGESPSTFSQANHLAAYSSQYQAWGASNVVDVDPRRYLHTAVLQESSGDMIIFGGSSDLTTHSDKSTRWLNVNRMVLDPIRHDRHVAKLGRGTGQRSSVGSVLTDNGDSTPEPITGLIQHSSILLNDTFMVVLGGNTYDMSNNKAVNLLFNKVYVYNIDTMKWSSVNCTGDIPPERSAFSASLHNDSIYIYAGVNVTGWTQFFGDLYKLDTISWEWTKLETPNAPVPRYAHQMKTLGHYLVVTHGYIETGLMEYSGDKNIYFYDLNARSFVDTYSPKRISHVELDTQWTILRTHRTSAISAICYIMVLLVFILALYYFVREIQDRFARRRRSVVRAPPARDTTIRSIVESYAENIRDSAHVLEDKYIKTISNRRRSSYDVDATTLASQFPDRRVSTGTRETSATKVNTRNSVSNRGSRTTRSQSVSEGTSTMIDGDNITATRQGSQQIARDSEQRRDSSVSNSTVQRVRRKLTLSAPIPTYRASRTGDTLSVRFSDNIDEYSEIYKDLEEEDNEENNYEDDDSFSNIIFDSHADLSTIDECAEDAEALVGSHMRENNGKLKVVNNAN
ncbi:hypothetical protein LPJ72_004883 [Coemansia sp. Benny D160-2]|nr:hypothetical protein LPJ72_004883 [Coemansia sp. Benny D160-2]